MLKGSKSWFVFYPIRQMTKSGIVAAYASHGMLIINRCKEEIFKTNEFKAGINFISELDKKYNHNFQKISNECFKYYKKNSLFKTAGLIINYLKKNSYK